MNSYDTDYALYLINTKQMIANMRNAFLTGDYDTAVALGTKAMVELRLTVLAMTHVRDLDKHKD